MPFLRWARLEAGSLAAVCGRGDAPAGLRGDFPAELPGLRGHRARGYRLRAGRGDVMALADPADRLAVMAADWFPGTAEAVGQVRRFVAGVLGGDCPGLDHVLLMVSEIATNAVLHTASGTPGGWFDLTVSVSAAESVIRVTVTDQGSISEPRVRRDGAHPGELDSGRGLSLVSVLADRWGYTGDWRRRVVWFELAARATP